MNYYGRCYCSQMHPLLRLNTYLRRWTGRKYRRLRSLIDRDHLGG